MTRHTYIFTQLKSNSVFSSNYHIRSFLHCDPRIITVILSVATRRHVLSSTWVCQSFRSPLSRLIPEYIKMADQYVPVPGGPNNHNYANVELIVDIAKRIPVQVSQTGCPSLPVTGTMP